MRRNMNRLTLTLTKLLLICFIFLLCATAPAQEEKESNLEYSRVTLGGSYCVSEEVTLSDSVTLHQDSKIQKGDKYEIGPLKQFGNNGIATAIGANSAYLQWISTSDLSITSYLVQRRSSPEEPWETICVLDSTSTSYVDSPLEPSTSYYYQVVAVDSKGETTVILGPALVVTPEEPPTFHGIGTIWNQYE